MYRKTLHILLVEDSAGDARLMMESLKDAGAGAFRIDRVSRLQEAIDALAKSPADAVLLDLTLPDSTGIQTVQRLQAAAPSVPIVVLTGMQNEELGLEAVRHGVQDYLVKGQCEGGLAGRALRYAVQRRRAEDELRDREARLRAVVDTAADGIITFDERGIIESVNPAAERLFGYKHGELLGRDVASLIFETYWSEDLQRIGRDLSAGATHAVAAGRETIGQRKDGDTVPLSVSASRFQLGGRQMYTAIIHDISNRRQLEREVLDAGAAEQRRIGQDLHDGLCQQLLATSFTAELLGGRLTDRAIPDEAAAAYQIGQMIRDAIGQARALAHGLNPVDLKGGGLTAALEKLTSQITSQCGISCTFRCGGPSPTADNATSLHLYRISQEAISNAIRHGKAKTIVVQLSTSTSNLSLSIRDDGVGLSSDQPSEGMGLRTMTHRANVIGGRLTVTPAREGGTNVTCSIPIQSRRGNNASRRASKSSRGSDSLSMK
jgi:two-component system sensor kinase FixL